MLRTIERTSPTLPTASGLGMSLVDLKASIKRTVRPYPGGLYGHLEALPYWKTASTLCDILLVSHKKKSLTSSTKSRGGAIADISFRKPGSNTDGLWTGQDNKSSSIWVDEWERVKWLVCGRWKGGCMGDVLRGVGRCCFVRGTSADNKARFAHTHTAIDCFNS